MMHIVLFRFIIIIIFQNYQSKWQQATDYNNICKKFIANLQQIQSHQTWHRKTEKIICYEFSISFNLYKTHTKIYYQWISTFKIKRKNTTSNEIDKNVCILQHMTWKIK